MALKLASSFQQLRGYQYSKKAQTGQYGPLEYKQTKALVAGIACEGKQGKRDQAHTQQGEDQDARDDHGMVCPVPLPSRCGLRKAGGCVAFVGKAGYFKCIWLGHERTQKLVVHGVA